MIWPAHAVDQQYVQPAIGIVIEEGAAGAERLGEILTARAAGVVGEVDAGLRGDVSEDNRRAIGRSSPGHHTHGGECEKARRGGDEDGGFHGWTSSL